MLGIKLSISSSMPAMLWSVTAIALLTGCGNSSAPDSNPAPVARTPWLEPVPAAHCGTGDLPEMALQGQITIPERLIGFAGARCNLELVGHWPGEGASLQHAAFGDCAYYGQAVNPAIPGRAPLQNPGTVVVDASDPAHPVATAYLTSVSMVDPWEALKVNAPRKLLAAVNGTGNAGGPEFDVYDLSGDCKHPALLASVTMDNTGLLGHEGNWTPDGLTYYGADVSNKIWYAIDVSNPRAPKQIAEFTPPGTGGVHGLSFNADGTRGYFVTTTALQDPLPDSPAVNGFYIFDTSEIQQRKPNPQVRQISSAFWKDGVQAQHTVPIFVGGHPYLILADEWGSAGPGAWASACAQDLPPFGFARIYDIADETNPVLASKLMLEVHAPANCTDVANDNLGLIGFGYDSHYCAVDDPSNASLLACAYFGAGLRVFDIRDPYRPRELAYYKPPAKPGYQPGSSFNSTGDCGTVDWVTSMPHFRLDRGEIWFTSTCNGFQIVRFTNDVLARR